MTCRGSSGFSLIRTVSPMASWGFSWVGWSLVWSFSLLGYCIHHRLGKLRSLMGLEVSPSYARGVGFDLGGCSFGHDHAAFVASFGAHVYDPVGSFYDVGVVFYDDDGVLPVHQFLDYLEEGVDVGAVEACGGFVHDVYVAFLLQFGGDLEALGFSSGEGA